MSRHTGSFDRLKGIVAPLATHVAANSQKLSGKGAESVDALPAPLRLAALRGEGVLRGRFFHHFGQALPHAPTAGQWLDYWQRFVLQRGIIADLVRRAGMYQATGLSQRPDVNDDELCFHLYCVLLDSLAQQNNEQLLHIAVERFFVYHWRQQFPTEVQANPERPNVTALRQRLERRLKKQYGNKAKLKESFEQSAKKVSFRLLLVLPNQVPQELIRLDGQRLKPTRVRAYERALDN